MVRFNVLLLPGVQVWKSDFRRHMVHQNSIYYKGLTPRHFVVSSTSVRRGRVINWKSVCIVLCINFLFSLEENCCWIIMITWRSLWWTCSIARQVWTMVSSYQTWWFRHKTRRKTMNMENCKKKKDVENGELQALLDGDDKNV